MPDPTIHVELKVADPQKSKRNGLLEFIASTSGAALMTVLLGGVAAQFISCDAQRRVQEREFNNTWLKARGDQALIARKEFVDGRRAALEEILRTVGAVSTGSDDLLYVTRPTFATKGNTKANKQLILAEQTRLFNQFTKAESIWAPSQPRFGFYVAYFGRGNTQLLKDWGVLQASVNRLRKCASETYERWYMAGQHKGSYTYNAADCQPEYGKVAANIEHLGTTFGVLSDQPWAGWGNPESLKRQLKIPN